jgi:magnesium chelatase accessory protein
VDLPGHGFTAKPPRSALSLPGMAAGLGRLLTSLDVAPALVAAHSAGAAVMLRMALDGTVAARGLVSLNGALNPYRGDAARWLSPLANALFVNAFVPRLIAKRAGSRAAVERLIRNTGSTIDAAGIDQYRTLVASPDHVAAALGMMANWDLQPLARDLPRLAVPLLLIAGEKDRAIKAEDALALRDRLPGATARILPGLGHLAHEEAPGLIAELILDFARQVGVLG